MLILDGGWCRNLPQPTLVVHYRLAADLPADVVLLHAGRDLRGPLGDVAVRTNALEKGVVTLVRIDGGLYGVLVPLSERGRDASPF